VLGERNVTLGEAQPVLAGLAGLRQADRQASALALIAVFGACSRPDTSSERFGGWWGGDATAPRRRGVQFTAGR